MEAAYRSYVDEELSEAEMTEEERTRLDLAPMPPVEAEFTLNRVRETVEL